MGRRRRECLTWRITAQMQGREDESQTVIIIVRGGFLPTMFGCFRGLVV